jgi:nucleoside-diphosphate-sugar epimerase
MRVLSGDGRILITGGAGFIGRHLALRFLEEGWDVDVLDNLCVEPLLPPVGNLIRKSVEEITAADLRNVSCVYHLAAWKSVPGSFDEPGKYLEALPAASRFFDAVLRAGIPRLIVVSTCEVYGCAERLPTPEDEPLRPRSPYAVAKAAIEMLTSVYRQAYGLDATVVRLFNVFGPGERPDAVIPAFCSMVLSDRPILIEGSGSQQRDFSHVSDIVEGLYRLRETAVTGGVVNLGRGETKSIVSVCDSILQVAGRGAWEQVAGRRQEIETFKADITLAGRQLGYAPRVDFEDGLRDTYDWWASHLGYRPAISTMQAQRR